MKMLLPIFVCLLGLCQAPAQEEKKPVRKPTLGDYEKVLKYFTTWSDNLSNPEHWKKVTFTNRKTKEVRKFTDLSDYEKHIFYFMSAEKLSNEMKRMSGFWEDELKKFKAPKEKPKDKDDEDEDQTKADKKEPKKEEKKDDPLAKEATKADVEKYCKQLLDIRKKTAVRYEALADKLFTTFKEKFTKEEIEQTMKQIRDFHDKEKLIERK